jgi:hypothetical protein
MNIQICICLYIFICIVIYMYNIYLYIPCYSASYEYRTDVHLYINTEINVNFYQFKHVYPLSKLISLYSHASFCSSFKVHQAVIAAGSEKSGCTVHFVTEEVDGGPIVLQGQCSVIQGTDSPESLKAKVNN